MSQGLSQLYRKKRQKDHVNDAFLDKGIFLREETASSWIAEIDSRYAILILKAEYIRYSVIEKSLCPKPSNLTIFYCLFLYSLPLSFSLFLSLSFFHSCSAFSLLTLSDRGAYVSSI